MTGTIICVKRALNIFLPIATGHSHCLEKRKNPALLWWNGPHLRNPSKTLSMTLLNSSCTSIRSSTRMITGTIWSWEKPTRTLWRSWNCSSMTKISVKALLKPSSPILMKPIRRKKSPLRSNCLWSNCVTFLRSRYRILYGMRLPGIWTKPVMWLQRKCWTQA